MKLAPIFQNGVILQANKPICIFGWSDKPVAVLLNGKVANAEPVARRWIAKLPSMQYGGPYSLTVRCDGEEIIIEDVYIGEVVLFSGQSNIQFHMWEEVTPKEQYKEDPMLRIFMCDRLEEGEKLFIKDGWVKAHPDNIDDWAALPYLTGKELREQGVPAVGVVSCSQGASNIQAWIEESLINGSFLDLPDELLADDCGGLYKRWNVNGRLFHVMLEPMIPFAFGNVVWYQGESNTSPAESEIYLDLLKVLIQNWRDKFLDSQLDFHVIQISDLNEEEPWKRVQRAQLDIAAELPHVKSVICGDICEKEEIHPPTKWKLAKRIAAGF